MEGGIASFITTNVPTYQDRLTPDRWFNIARRMGINSPCVQAYFNHMDYKNRKDRLVSSVIALKGLEGEVDFKVGSLLFDLRTNQFVSVGKVTSTHTKAGHAFSLTIKNAIHKMSTPTEREAFAERFLIVEFLPYAPVDNAALEMLVQNINSVQQRAAEGDEKVVERLEAYVRTLVATMDDNVRTPTPLPLPSKESGNRWWRLGR